MARRYGVRPCRVVGLDPDADEPSRIRAYHLDRLAAHAGVWQEVTLARPAPAAPGKAARAEAEFDPRYGLKGRIPVSNEPIPDWLENLFPEGPLKKPKAA